jgi:UDP-3-O-[3-hydroxymyristoyl] glucosamine N-acyltransferase
VPRRGEDGSVLTAQHIVDLVGGVLEGDGAAVVQLVAPLDRAGPGALTVFGSSRYRGWYATTQASVVLVDPSLAAWPGRPRARILVEQPQDRLVELLPYFAVSDPRPSGIHPTAVVEPGASIGPGVTIEAYAVIAAGAQIGAGAWVGPHVVIGRDAVIGEQTRIHDRVSIGPRTEVGARCVLHPGVRLGGDGFGFVARDGAAVRIPHIGRCILHDDVEVGPNSTIDRGSIDDTVIGAGTKLDALVHVAHNVRIGRGCVLAAQVGIAGSSRIEDGCVLGGQVGLAGHLTIGAGAKLAAKAGVFGDVPAGETWSGYPARPHREALRAQAAMFRLPQLMKGLEQLVEGESSPAPSGTVAGRRRPTRP